MEKTLSAIAETQAPMRPVRAPIRRPSSPPKTSSSMTTHCRKFFGNRFVYALISQRAHGLSIGVNVNPDKFCNFDCVYCEVDRRLPASDAQVDLEVMSAELSKMLALAHLGTI